MIILTEVNKNNIFSVNNEKIIHLVNKFRNFILYSKNYYYIEFKNYKNCKNYYIGYYYYRYELISIAYYNYLGKFHREDGHAYIKYYENGQVYYKEYYLNDEEYSYEDYLLEIKK